jgi:hypothetical protein
MDDAPKRSLRDTITQLIVIAILIALIIGSVIYLRQYIDSRNSSEGAVHRSTPVALIVTRGDARTSSYDLAS